MSTTIWSGLDAGVVRYDLTYDAWRPDPYGDEVRINFHLHVYRRSSSSTFGYKIVWDSMWCMGANRVSGRVVKENQPNQFDFWVDSGEFSVWTGDSHAWGVRLIMKAPNSTGSSGKYDTGTDINISVPAKQVRSRTIIVRKGTGISDITSPAWAWTGNYKQGTATVGSSFTVDVALSKGYHWKNWSGTFSTTTQRYTFTVQDKDYDITANGVANTYTIKYNGNGSTGGSTANSTHTYDTAKTLTKNGFTRTGYSFAGWNTKADGSGTSYTNGQSVKNLTSTNGATVNLYAKWTINSYKATFNSNGGTTPNPSTITKNYGAQLGTLPTTSRTGYTFKGWFTAASGGTKISTTTTMPASNPTYYAQWTANTYTIAFNGNGATGGSTASMSMTYDVAKNLTKNGFVRTGYKFLGWATNKTATNITYTDGQSVKNLSSTNGATINLYAIWEEEQVKVNIKSGGVWKSGKLYYKKSGNWVPVRALYIKVNGVWKEAKK